ncbi:TerB family tellurite resistance protein [Oceanicella actignis]|uniref:DnaJ like chaperone protein n=1 Tax=Oceanicella actignis TaxID=1189325 RepID=A0A1M7TET6_9RHOB|nr:TerB family tellurite resistance protein [Oceanicella actignis]SET62127.1 DnaJ like chaperone protein [Oceanicella actignis]SHN69168.1 DnaJ like chaperone protein [Oceanicella actignis]
MSIWSRIGELIAALRQGESLASVFDRLRTPPERSAGFAIAVIALGAKMAKADGRVTRDEVAAFREVFRIPPRDEAAAARVFDLARGDVAGFEGYARRIARMFRDRKEPLAHLLEGLFHIAAADGRFDPAEEGFLRRVWEIFGLDERVWRALIARYVPGAPPNPWEVLGLSPGASLEEARRARARLVRETHPDRLLARGVPEEGIRLANARMAAINEAYEAIRRHHEAAAAAGRAGAGQGAAAGD